MIWPFRRRDVRPAVFQAIVGLEGQPPGSGYPLRLEVTDLPVLRHTHTIKHEPYPKPTSGFVQVLDDMLQPVWTGPIYCRGGAESTLDMHIQRAYPDLNLPPSLPPLRLRFRWDYS